MKQAQVKLLICSNVNDEVIDSGVNEFPKKKNLYIL